LATTRVYILARELGVKSSAIVKKCQSEGLDVKNHMAAISAGLAATIREWFSEGENVTTIETADKVDLKKVRVKKRAVRKKMIEQVADAEDETADTLVAEVAQAVAEPPVEVEGAAAVVEAAPPAVEPEREAELVAQMAVPAVEEEEKLPQEEQAEEVEAPVEEVKPEPEPEPEPEPIMPAGPMLKKPKPAKLSGPRGVRVEAPEPLDRPRPRSRPRRDRAVTEPLMSRSTGEGESKAGVAGKGGKRHKDRTHGRRKQESDQETARKSKLRTKWRQRDIEERQARLSAAGGEGLRLRPTRKITAKGQREAAGAGRPKKVAVSEPITVKDLSAALAVKAADIIGRLMQQGTMATANQTISSDLAELVALEYDT